MFSAGFPWFSTISVLVNLLVGGVIVAIIRNQPVLKKISADREANLLQERADEMEAMRARIDKLEADRDATRAIHDAERALDRHKINNLQACFDAVILLIEANPEKAPEVATKIKAMRAGQMQAEALEKATLHGKRIDAAGQRAGVAK